MTLWRPLLAAGFLSILAVLPSTSQAQTYPDRLVRVIAAFPPGSGADILVRYMSEKLKPLMNQTVVVENRAGAGGMVGAEYLARSKPDGYTILIHSGITFANMMHMLKTPSIDAAKTVQMAAMVNRQPFMIVVEPKSAITTVKELTAHLKTKDGKAAYGWAATISKVIGELYAQKAGVSVREVSYRSGPDMLNDILGGVLDFGILDPAAAISNAREGRLRVVATASIDRMKAVPDIPTLRENGIDVVLEGWFGVMVPAGTPRPIVDKLNEWTNKILNDDDTRAFLAKIGTDPWVTSVDDAQKIYLDEIRAWAEYVRLAKIEPQ